MIEVDHFHNDSVARLDTKQFLARAIDRTISGAGKVVADRSDLAVVVGGGKCFGEEAVGLAVLGGEVVEIGDSDRVAGSELENIVLGKLEDIIFGGDVLNVAVIDVHHVNGYSFASVF